MSSIRRKFAFSAHSNEARLGPLVLAHFPLLASKNGAWVDVKSMRRKSVDASLEIGVGDVVRLDSSLFASLVGALAANGDTAPKSL